MQVQVWIHPWAKLLPELNHPAEVAAELLVPVTIPVGAAEAREVLPVTSLQHSKGISVSKIYWIIRPLPCKFCRLCREWCHKEWSWRKLMSEEWRSLKTTSWSYSFMLLFFPDGSEGGLWFLTSHSWWFGGELSCLFVDRRFTERGEHYHVPKEQQTMTQATHHWDRVEGMKVLNCLWKNVLMITNITKVIFKVYMEFLKEAGEHNFFVPCLM